MKKFFDEAVAYRNLAKKFSEIKAIVKKTVEIWRKMKELLDKMKEVYVHISQGQWRRIKKEFDFRQFNLREEMVEEGARELIPLVIN